MNDLAEWLLEQIAADEFRYQRARLAGEAGPDMTNLWLAECEAKRRIVELHSGDAPWCGWTQGGDGTHGDMRVDPVRPAPQDCATLRFLAAPYADRPGYLEEWRTSVVAS